MLPADAQPRHITGQFMQAQRQAHSFFPRHATVSLDLKILCGLRCH